MENFKSYFNDVFSDFFKSNYKNIVVTKNIIIVDRFIDNELMVTFDEVKYGKCDFINRVNLHVDKNLCRCLGLLFIFLTFSNVKDSKTTIYLENNKSKAKKIIVTNPYNVKDYNNLVESECYSKITSYNYIHTERKKYKYYSNGFLKSEEFLTFYGVNEHNFGSAYNKEIIRRDELHIKGSQLAFLKFADFLLHLSISENIPQSIFLGYFGSDSTGVSKESDCLALIF